VIDINPTRLTETLDPNTTNQQSFLCIIKCSDERGERDRERAYLYCTSIDAEQQ